LHIDPPGRRNPGSARDRKRRALPRDGDHGDRARVSDCGMTSRRRPGSSLTFHRVSRRRDAPWVRVVITPRFRRSNGDHRQSGDTVPLSRLRGVMGPGELPISDEPRDSPEGRAHLLQPPRWAAEMTRNPRGAQETIDRREALRRAALLLGGALAAPTVAGVLAGCQAARLPDGAWAPRALTQAQAELVAAMAEHIRPET